MTTNLSFDKLPEAVWFIQNELLEIKRLLSNQPTPQVIGTEADALLTLEQAASFLKLAKPTIYGLVQRKEIPAMKRGNRLYFSRQELTEWIKAGRKLTKAELEQQAELYLANRKGRKS